MLLEVKPCRCRRAPLEIWMVAVVNYTIRQPRDISCVGMFNLHNHWTQKWYLWNISPCRAPRSTECLYRTMTLSLPSQATTSSGLFLLPSSAVGPVASSLWSWASWWALLLHVVDTSATQIMIVSFLDPSLNGIRVSNGVTVDPWLNWQHEVIAAHARCQYEMSKLLLFTFHCQVLRLWL